MRRQALHPLTAVINKSQKNHSKRARHDALNWLAKKFPEAFDNSQRIQPLKTGIMDDILAFAEEAAEAGLSKSKLREAVVIFTRRLDYLACLKAREMRVDLQGNPVSVVTEDEAERAAVKIKRRIEKGLKNARNATEAKAAPATAVKSDAQHPLYPQNATDYASQYAERLSAYSASGPEAVMQTNRSAAVIVKHRNVKKTYDPEAVARLKEKLGLSRREEETEASN
ncbi:activator of prop osmoprotectant transporter [Legionella taurinensis]|uniref:Activator of prop osmoprotectant transporter n=1 Tax=Legionella taurinensis TaxID=70611 RepID=A0A3A5L1Z7_9GAMM|nr:ProQ/FinO family protein [Legionella taurinensis]MDX1836055.1 ProQ/FinO family protein [Legionella taurinensis]PUT42168.1 activator of prop osmoprotectant transporter [Legionella taurinensis]PUT44955.1 activator of prop osmoprotectant transporter [Legionella taurinensis]PUT48277.1 activator of prop osmoprotectant transporter [Legionella taurinensis]PUT49090.1 activator of prop osmoprotectant transporter [Legionella taurinensis]